jgi:threonine/homoserine/homoserine lactone efflux protein
MAFRFLATSFLVGILAASGVGPIFVLTFNRAAIHGFWRGFATALGAATIDSLYFFLALIGILATVAGSPRFIVILDFVGGTLLLFFSRRCFRAVQRRITVDIGRKENIILTFSHASLMTLVNPMTLLFFMIIASKILPEDVHTFSFFLIIASSLMVLSGSLLVLTSVSMVATFIGHRISQRTLHFISFLTGVAFLGFGLYLLGHMTFSLYRGF